MGTTMRVERFGIYTAPYTVKRYDVDADFLAKYGALDPILPTGKEYLPGNDDETIHVYLNGQRVHRGAGYKEVDDKSIQLQLDGMELTEGDVVYMETHENYYCSHGSAIVSGDRFLRLEKEIHDARGTFETLDKRIEFIQRQLVLALTGGINVEKIYDANPDGFVTVETITGDVELRRLFTYYGDEESGRLRGELFTETVQEKVREGVYRSVYVVTRYYDPITRRQIREKVTVL